MNREFLKNVKKNIRLIHRMSPSFIPLTFAIMLFERAIPFAAIILGAQIVDMLAAGASFNEIMTYAIILTGTVFLLSLAKEIFGVFQGIGRVRLYDNRNIALAGKTMALDYDILEKNDIRELMAKAQNNVDAMGGLNGYTRTVLDIFGTGFSILGAVVTMRGLFMISRAAGEGILFSFFRSPVSTILLLLLMGAGIWLGGRCEAGKGKIQYKVDMANVNSSRIYWYFFNLMFQYPAGKDIRIFHMGNIIRARSMSAMTEIDNIKKDALHRTLKIDFRNYALQYGFMLCAYLFAGLKAILGIISVGGLTKYVSTLLLLQGQIRQLSSTLIWLKTQNTYLSSYSEYLEIPNEKYEGTLPVEKRIDNEYELEFKNVSFGYPGSGEMALKNVSFRLRTGGRLAIVGANGAGKTTFIKLLCRLYDPTEGEILLNGINVKKYDYNEYIRLFSVVFQDYKIFSFSVAENVSASQDFDEDRVRRSLEEAGLYDRVTEMKEGIHTKLLKDQQEDGEEGLEISGGEKQKLALARALYRDAPVVILDEPTSALDPIAEQDIYQRFNRMVEDKTAIFISHRMSSCRFCDTIVVFDEGHIVQTGSHEELLQDKEGIYSRMWEAQARYYV
ncbi:MAG: ABC transporter ATP-binding protein/permease [Acetatifactor sp.]|nr:ABC transporter ATP-binding protein/permease [Acetatifactor sp.]